MQPARAYEYFDKVYPLINSNPCFATTSSQIYFPTPGQIDHGIMGYASLVVGKSNSGPDERGRVPVGDSRSQLLPLWGSTGQIVHRVALRYLGAYW